MEDYENSEREQKHLKTKKRIKILGFILLIIGAVLTVIGFISFFTSFGSFDSTPKFFWMAFIGLPIMSAGGACLSFGYNREVARYMKNESAPVFNEASEDYGKGIYNVAKTIKQAIKDEPMSTDNTENTNINNNNNGSVIKCSKCGTINDEDSSFCKECGRPLKTICPNCGEKANGSDKYCGNCGHSLR